MKNESKTNAVEIFISQIEDKILERDNCLDEEKKSNFLYDLWKESFYEKFLYDELNIVGGAFSVLEKVSNESLLLFSKESNHSKDVKNSDFFWFPYEVKYKDKAIAKTIDTLFLTTRKSQKLNHNPPDFLKYLEIGLNYEFNDLTCNKIFNKKGVLYCDASEILIFLLCYFVVLNKYINCNSGFLNWPANSIESISTTDSNDTIKKIYFEIGNGEKLDFNKLYTSLGLLEKGSETNLFKSTCERIQQCIQKETTIANIQDNVDEILSAVFKIREYNGYDECIKILHEAARFPILPYIELYTKLDEKITGLSHLVFPVWQSFAFVPEFTFRNKSKKSYNVVFALLTVKEKAVDNNYEDYFKDLYKTIDKLGSIVADMVFYNSFANKSITHQAIKSAQTKIISRNFSHHIGSHVMPNVSLKQINERYKELCNSEIDLEYLDDLKTRLDTYITERNEFLCDQDTSFRSVLFFSQIIVPFLENFLVLDNLCRSEGLGFRKNIGCDVEIHVKINGNPITTKYNDQNYPVIPYNGLFERDFDGNFSTIPARIIGKDISIAVPNIHIVFSILENFIRNTAKHQKKEFEIDSSSNCLKDNLIVTLDILEDIKNKNSFWLNISDNKSIVEIDFPQKIESQIIEVNNEIAQCNLGIIDFKICAGLLNKKSFEEVDEDIFRINRGEKGELSYDFKILKPNNICFIGYTNEKINIHPTFDYYETVQDFLMAEVPSLPYQFYIVREEAFIELLDLPERISALPFRLLVESKNKSEKDLVEYFQPKKFGRRYLLSFPIDLSNSEGDILKQCWEKWLTRWGNNKKELIIYSQQKLPGWNKTDFKSNILDFQYGFGTENLVKNLSDNYPKVFYDHHGGGVSNTNFPEDKSFYSDNSYIEFGKNSKDQPFINFSKPSANWLLPYQLAEAGLAKILIIDERLVDIAEKAYEGRQSKDVLVNKGHLKYAKYTNNFENFSEEYCKIHNVDALWAANISVATHLNGIPIKKELFNEDWHHIINVNIDGKGINTENKFEYLKIENCPVRDATLIENQQYDAVIIHRTFFNNNSRSTHWNGRSEEDIFSLLSKLFPLVVITSGGGDMVSFNGNFKFISINHLLSYLKVPSNIGKHALIDEIFSKSKNI